MYVVTPATVNAATIDKLRTVSCPGETESVPRNADVRPDETAWTLYVPGCKPREYVPSTEADAVALMPPDPRVVKAMDAATPFPPVVVRPRTVVLSSVRVAGTSNAIPATSGGTSTLPEKTIRTYLRVPETLIVVRSSTDTVKFPSGTGTRYVPEGSLRARKTPPSARVRTIGMASVNSNPSTVKRPDTWTPETRAIGRSVGPATSTVRAKVRVSEPCVRFAYTVYVPGARYVR